MQNLYIDAEWFIDQKMFLLGICSEHSNVTQLHGRALNRKAVINLLSQVKGHIYFYGPDIGMLEKCFNLKIRHRYSCINLLKAFRRLMPELESFKLAHIEEVLGVKRNESKYKGNIYSIKRDWFGKNKMRVMVYNADDVINLREVKRKLFKQHKVNVQKLDEYRLT